MVPQTQKQWTLRGTDGPASLHFQPDAPVPSIGDREVLVRIHAATLNFRDYIISKGIYPFPVVQGTVPVSDGAGVVAAVGPGVTRFKVGDRVVALFFQDHLEGPFHPKYLNKSLGSVGNGMLQEYGAFSEDGLVNVPGNLSLAEAAALPCAGVTAWSALYPEQGRTLRPGETVLVEGTGGVSTFALQFARAGGARIIATTSSDEKARRLKELGASHVLNYKENPNWGGFARSLTPNEEGVDVVVEVGGPASARQALSALKAAGSISMVGTVGSFASNEDTSHAPTFIETVTSLCTMRGVTVGSRRQFEEMNRAIEGNDIHPHLDKRLFKLEEAREAYEFLWERKHFGKVVVQISE